MQRLLTLDDLCNYYQNHKNTVVYSAAKNYNTPVTVQLPGSLVFDEEDYNPEEGLLKTIILINPTTAPVEVFRYAILGQGTIIPQYYIMSVVLTIIVTIIGVVIFNKVEKTFMDTV